MRTLRKILVTASVLFSLLFIECDDDNRFSCDFAICTMEFRSIVVSLKHENDSTAFVLTDYKVIRISDNKDITISDDNLTDNNGYYPITNDTKVDLFKFKNVEVEFTGYFNRAIVIQKRFTVTADCCHISLVEGDTKFFL
jgi:hypothetical protein